METKVYAARIQKREVLNVCSSGGAFTVLSDEFLDRGDAVLCAGYNYDTHQTEFRMVLNAQERDACRGSMYMQAYALDSWKEAVKWLNDNADRKLVFFGLGCQGAAFRRFCNMKGLSDRVTVVDIICHGVPSPAVWRDYARFLEREGALSAINFRDKRDGWNKSVGVARSGDKEISLSRWRKAYSSKVMLRPSCTTCPYTRIDRETDITIGDFWHLEDKMPEFFDDMGTSLFLIHTEKGMELFDSVKDKLEFRVSNRQDCWQFNLEKPTQHAVDRVDFWRDYRKKSIDYVMEKYGTSNFKRKLQRKLRSLLG